MATRVCTGLCVCVLCCVHTHLLFPPSLSCESFVKPEISPSALSLQASLQTTLRKLQDVKFAISLGGRLSEHMFD